MIEDIYYLYVEYGIWPFVLAGSFVIIFGFFIVVFLLQGSDYCLHFSQFGDYCSYCGEALQEYCSACGKAVENVPFCAYCGHALN